MNQVTIGIPLFNEEKHIADAIRSAAPQCSRLIISDNCSSDESESICRQLCDEFPNIEYIKQSTNIGAANNFKLVMEKATTDYFMWLGAHDAIPESYVNELLSVLDAEKEAVLAYGNSLHIDIDNHPIWLYEYIYAEKLASSDPKNRLLAIIRHLSDCSMIHGLFVTKNLKENWVDMNFLGGDHVFLAQIALSGKMILNPRTQLYRREVHINDNLKEQLTRIKGNSNNDYLAASRKQQMQRMLADLAKNQVRGRLNFYFLKSYYYLIINFGNFSNTKILSLIEYAVWNTARVIRRLKKITIS